MDYCGSMFGCKWVIVVVCLDVSGLLSYYVWM